MFTNYLAVNLVFNFILIQKGITLECFNCKSSIDGDCDYHFAIMETQTCDEISRYCYEKIVLTTIDLSDLTERLPDDFKYIQRGCSTSTYCPSSGIILPGITYCYTCESDLCNSELTSSDGSQDLDEMPVYMHAPVVVAAHNATRAGIVNTLQSLSKKHDVL